jgi:hypothetical protein
VGLEEQRWPGVIFRGMLPFLLDVKSPKKKKKKVKSLVLLGTRVSVGDTLDIYQARGLSTPSAFFPRPTQTLEGTEFA